MAKLSNARTILDIEAIVASSDRLGRDRHHWQVKGVECTRESHRYSGSTYAFTIEVLQLKLIRARRTVWHAVLVTEWWRGTGEANIDLRSTRWLKLVRGTNSDVTAWVRANRDARSSHDTSADLANLAKSE